MPSRTRELGSLLRLVDATGVPAPERFNAIRSRLDTLQSIVCGDGKQMFRRLAAAVIEGGADIETALWNAVTERTRDRLPEVAAEVHEAVKAALIDAYTPVALPNYRTLADEFNRVATAFTRAADACDPTTPADSVVNLIPKILQAWQDSARSAKTLDSMLPALSAAAELLRGESLPRGLGIDTAPFELPLCCDPTGVHRRQVWAAWRDTVVP
ncbi:MAG TPA: hypothetical protein VLZ05_14960, partial [Mycobacterium sp.]